MSPRKYVSAFLLLCALSAAGWVSAQGKGMGKGHSHKKSTASSDSGLQASLEKLERAGWEAYKKKDKKAFADLETDDYSAGIADGQGGRDKQSTINSMGDVTINRYNLSDFKLTTIDAEAALLTYNAELNMAVGKAKAQNAKLYVSDLWVKRGGQWKSLHYQETERK